MSAGMLFAQMDSPEGREQEFHEWYDQEHIPSRLAVEGFSAGSRYELLSETGPQWLVIYEIDRMEALETPEYRRLHQDPSARTRTMLAEVRNFRRMTCDLVADSGPAGEHGLLFVVAFDVPAGEREDFEDFYQTEHTELMLRGPDWLRVRRYRVQQEDVGWTDLVVHELGSRSALDSPEAEAARRAPKRQRIAGRPWFVGSDRWLYAHRSRQDA